MNDGNEWGLSTFQSMKTEKINVKLKFILNECVFFWDIKKCSQCVRNGRIYVRTYSISQSNLLISIMMLLSSIYIYIYYSHLNVLV